jgi:phytoene dehydrogenase-like protein
MKVACDEATDMVIIGSGIGGLTAAILLLKLGYRVTVVEKNPLPGGLMRSYRRSGFSCPVGVHYVGSLGDGQPLRRMFDYLGVTDRIALERMGVNGIIDQYIFDDRTFNLPEGVDPFEENLRQAFPQDQIQITMIMKYLREIAGWMDRLEDLFSPGRDFLLNEALVAPLGDLLRELNGSPGLRSVLGVTCSWIGVPLDECPVYLHHMALASYLFSSWRCNGTEMADAFVRRTKEIGGIILVGDPVEKVLLHEKTAAGVVLESGRTIRASTVIGAIHPKTLLPLLPVGAVRPAYIDRIRQLRDTCGVFCAHYTVNAKDHPEIPFNIFNVETDEQGGVSDPVFYQLRSTDKPGVNIFSIITSIEPEAWRPWENTRTGNRGQDYIEAKEKKAGDLIQKAGKIVGPFKEERLIDAYTHLTIRDWVGSPGGAAYGVLRSTRQLTRAAMLNRTSIRGLHLAGQSVLAPGVFGTTLGSFHTVRHIIGPDRFSREVLLS